MPHNKPTLVLFVKDNRTNRCVIYKSKDLCPLRSAILCAMVYDLMLYQYTLLLI
jgi:hypothetical protein